MPILFSTLKKHFIVSIALIPLTAQAADFTIVNTQTAAQTLGDNETGIIEIGGQLNTGANSAIDANGLNITINNAGTITTDIDGIHLDGSNAILINSGLITAGDDGIDSLGAGATITNTGTITAGNTTSNDGIRVGGNNTTVINSGTITAGDDGIDSYATDVVIINSGTITVTGAFSDGIRTTESNTTIINRGTITASDDGIESTSTGTVITNFGTIIADDEGIYSTGNNAVIRNSGTISTTGVSGVAIYSSGSHDSLSNDGLIITKGEKGYGIRSAGENSNISNNGTISTEGLSGYGISLLADYVVASNNGSIITEGEKGYGIRSDAEYAQISNNGTISTEGVTAYGINSYGNSTSITNNGTISTIGNDSYGVRLDGEYVQIINNGIINTAGQSGHGIRSFSDSALIINNGDIFISGKFSNGIDSNGDNASISNNGNISSSGQYSAGILAALSATSVTINNSGNISTSGDSADGISLYSSDSIINNSGSITTYGNTAFAIHVVADNAIINNSGLISAIGIGAASILGGGDDQYKDSTVNLLAGSQIIGTIDLGGDDNAGGDNDTVNIYAGSVSANLTLFNVENINLIGAAAIISGNNVVTVDPTTEIARSLVLSGTTSAIHNTVSQRATHKTPFKPVQVAALTLSPGMLFQQRTPTAWAQAFGGISNHDAEGSSMAYGSNHIGFTLGYEWDIDQTRVGLLGGVVHSKTKTDIVSSQTESDSYYIGGYGLFSFDSFNLSTSLIGGYASNDNTRLVIDNLNGVEVAKSDFSSVFISPSVTISSAYAVADRLELRPSVSLNYSMAWLNDYQEQGTANSNLSIDDRTLKVATARSQISAAYQLDDYSEFSFRVGVSSRHSNDDDIQGSFAGNSFSFTNAGDENVSGKFAGINLRVANQNNLTLVVDMEFGGSSKEDYRNGEISLEYSF